jgi:deoxyribodipyrimidine photo-lyase
VDLLPAPVSRDSLDLFREADCLDLADIDAVLSQLKLDRGVPPVSMYRGGTSEAKSRLKRFLRHRLDGYAASRGCPEIDGSSRMSMYLHFGQISPVDVALRIQEASSHEDDRASFIEELVVRRELALNFVHNTEDYDRYTCLPGWARATLVAHRGDERPHRYSHAQLDAAATHDAAWNAAMHEMKHTGYMHNHMRMYWGKKILEWSAAPQSAYAVALALNNRYFLDGRDPASFANVGWLFGLHDRPWPERPVYGSIRSMSAAGLERKADVPAYINRVDELVSQATAD